MGVRALRVLTHLSSTMLKTGNVASTAEIALLSNRVVQLEAEITQANTRADEAAQAAILAAEGERQAAIKKAEGTSTSMQILSEALRSVPENKEILRYLVAQDYINASYRLGESPNSKVVFVDPGSGQNEIIDQITAETVAEDTARRPNNGNSSES